MNELMSVLKVSNFDQILSAYKKAGIDVHSCLDGGAVSGSTAKSMLSYMSSPVRL
jgi:hypothetical protein